MADINKDNTKYKFGAQIREEGAFVFTIQPTENLSASAVFKVWNDIPYANLSEDLPCYFDDNGELKYVELYSASFNYETSIFDLNGYYHVGHASFEEAGDIFSISKEAFDIIGSSGLFR